MIGMAIMTVNPFEGIGIVSGGDYTASHQGQDYKTPRIYDYTAPSDGVVEYVGGTYHSIIVRRSDGTKWRLAECAIILVSVGQSIKLGQVIARNSYYRGGIYRSPHLNAGGDVGRSKFTGIVTHTKAQAAAIIAAGSEAEIRKRTVKKGINAVRRMGPGTRYNKVGELLAGGTVGNFIAFAHGPISQGQPVGNDVWFKGISGQWFWSGSFTSTATTGLTDLTAEFADVVVELPPVIEVPPVVIPEPEAPEGPVEIPELPPVVTPPPVVVVPPVDNPDGTPDEPPQWFKRFIYALIEFLSKYTAPK